jgi:hypothetical protein
MTDLGFSFAEPVHASPPSGVTRRIIRKILIVALFASSMFAAWSWFRPYAWAVDPAARCKVVGCQVRKDHAYFWVDVHLKVIDGQTHDLKKPVCLRTGAGREIQPADTTMAGNKDIGTTDLWYKFWLETDDIREPLTLRINDGSLVIKADPGIPRMSPSNSGYFPTQHW